MNLQQTIVITLVTTLVAGVLMEIIKRKYIDKYIPTQQP